MKPRIRLLLAKLSPFAACVQQWLLWDAYIKPYVWFLFLPAASIVLFIPYDASFADGAGLLPEYLP